MSAYKNVLSRIGILAILVAGLIVIVEKPASAYTCPSCMTALQACNQRCQASNPTFTCVQACESQFLACEAKC